MFKRIIPAIACLILPATLASGAEQARAAAKAAPGRTIQFQDVRLKNGLRVILSEDHSAPVYSIAVTYNVGSRNEVKGRTGFAHLFEHIMFEGSANVGRNEHSTLIKEMGGSDNGTTDSDRTLYFETLPANQLELGIFLEADRMRALNLTQQTLDNQRKAVQEERRFRVDNQPYGTTFEAIDDTIFDSFSYKHSTIGSMADLDAATLDDVKDFFRIYYAPDNACVSIVGDFDSKAALEKVKKYFESIPSQPAPPTVVVEEGKQTAERRRQIEDAFAPLPRLTIGYKTAPDNTPDNYALEILMSVLNSGQSSRLYQKLVKEQQLAAQVNGSQQGQRGVGAALMFVTPRPGKSLDDIEKSVYEEIDKLKKEPPTDAEIAKVRAQLRYRRAVSLQGSLLRAIQFTEFATFFDDPNLMNTVEQKYAAVTRQDLQRVANQYFEAGNRSVIITVPKPKTAAGAPAGK
jgi:predicted Zn-dependent peptidase